MPSLRRNIIPPEEITALLSPASLILNPANHDVKQNSQLTLAERKSPLPQSESGVRFRIELLLPFLHFQLSERMSQGSVDGGYFGIVELLGEAGFGSSPGFLGFGLVNILGFDGHVRKD